MYKFTVIRFVIIHTLRTVTSVGTLNKKFSSTSPWFSFALHGWPSTDFINARVEKGIRTSHHKAKNFKVCHPRCVCNSLGGRRIVNTTQLIRKKVYILICINYMFRPTVAIIRFITDLRGSHISGWGYW